MNRARMAGAAAVAAVLGIGVAGVAYAVSTPTQISACYIKGTGAVRIIDSGTCKKGETALVWNQAGVPGTNGTPGTDGTNGVSGYEVVTNEVSVAANSFSAAGVSCPTGKKVLGGGAVALIGGQESVTTAINFVASFPTPDGVGWRIGYSNGGSGIVTQIQVRATCASVAP